MVGKSLGSYLITAKLGEGGMGEVYRATDSKLKRQVAIKVLPAAMAADAERLERFRREAQAVAALSHPNIVTLYSIEEAEGISFLTMELVEGAALDVQIPAGGLALEEWLEIGIAIAEAVAAAHGKGIVHRDLKPANVMIGKVGGADERRRVKILDFGLARMAEPAAESLRANAPTLLTREGVVMGTLPYMSPEQVRGLPLDERTDLFSLGVILYEMATGHRPFRGETSAELGSAILRDPPPPLTARREAIPADVERILRRCLEKEPRDRIASARALYDELRLLRRDLANLGGVAGSAGRVPAAPADSGAVRSAEGFSVTVLPFKYGGGDSSLTTLAEGLTEEVVTGLSRFSYLRVVARTSAPARYRIEGSLRQSGSKLRLAVQLVDTTSGAHLWAENYERAFSPESVFALQDDLVPRIVSTVADQNGVLTRRMSETLRSRSEDALTPHEAVLRAFTYFERVTPEEHAVVRRILERAVREAPDHADCWAMLSIMYTVEFADGFNPGPDPLGRALAAGQRAVDLAATNALGHYALAFVYFLRKETLPFRASAEKALALNPMDGSVMGLLGVLVNNAGELERGCQMVDAAMQLNPNYPGLFRWAAFAKAYAQGRYAEALELAVRINMPNYFYAYAARSAALGQLGRREAAEEELRELLALRPDFAAEARRDFAKWYHPELVEKMLEGLRKAGLDIGGPVLDTATRPRAPEAVAIAVLPFSDMSSAKDQEYLCEGMAEEIMNALVRVDGIRVASRTSSFRARRDGADLPAIARALSVNHLLEGSVRTSGSRLRVTAQLTDVGSGYQLWSERFDRDAADVFAVQDEIAAGVVEAVKSRLSPGQRTIVARRPSHNLDAYRSYLRGRYLRHTKNDHRGALAAYEEAARLDPSYAPAWVGVAECNMLAAHYGFVPARGACARAKEALATAARLEEESAETCWVEGFLAYMERDWPAWESAYRRALELQPEHVQALGTFAMVLAARGRIEDALPLFERARAADPLAAFPYAITGVGLVAARRPRESERFFEDALTFEGQNTLALWGAGSAQVALGRFEAGIETLERAVAVAHRTDFFLALLGWALAAAGRSVDARAVLDELRSRSAAGPTVLSEAWLHAALGDAEAAFEVLARAEDESQPFLCYTGLPGFDPLRADPRFAALEERLGLNPWPPSG